MDSSFKDKVFFSESFLRGLESKCVQSEPPWCNAMCPIHVDVREICKLVSAGKFTEARKVYEDRVVFPNIMSKICEQKCKTKCLRNGLGDAINIRDIELACMKYGQHTKKRVFRKFKKKGNVLVAGSSLSGLIAALEIKLKGYTVDLFEKADILGKDIYEQNKGILDEDSIKQDLKKLTDEEVNICLNTEFNIDDLDKYKEKYDVIIIDGNVYDLDLSYNEVSLQHEDDIVFYMPKSDLAIDRIDYGKRATNSIYRFFQKSNMYNARETEGSHDTKLITVLDKIEPQEPVAMENKEFYTEEEAIKEASRCIDCNCLECIKGCEFLRHYGETPVKLTRTTQTNLAISVGNHTANKMINSCSLCGQCAEICPNGVDFVDFLRWTRSDMVRTENMPQSAFEFAWQDMEFSNSDEYFTIINPKNTSSDSKYVFFPGCQMGASEPDLVKVIYKDLNEKLDDTVGIMLGCCGAIGPWSGQVAKFKEAIGLIKKSIEEMGSPHVITACPTCYKIFKENLENVEISMVYDYIDDKQLKNIGNSKCVAVDDPCSARYEVDLQDKVREISEKLGYNLEELDYNKKETTCCGYGGLTCFSHRELREDIVQSRIDQSDLDYITYCINCRDAYLGQNKNSKHILQLIYDFEGKNKKPNLSERRYNRVQLKLDLLGKSDEKNDYEVNLIISKELEEKFEEKLILFKDVYDTISYAEANNEKFFNKKNNTFLAYRTIKNVTFWVEYTIEGDKYLVHNAYSHRMKIEAVD